MQQPKKKAEKRRKKVERPRQWLTLPGRVSAGRREYSGSDCSEEFQQRDHRLHSGKFPYGTSSSAADRAACEVESADCEGEKPRACVCLCVSLSHCVFLSLAHSLTQPACPLSLSISLSLFLSLTHSHSVCPPPSCSLSLSLALIPPPNCQRECCSFRSKV